MPTRCRRSPRRCAALDVLAAASRAEVQRRLAADRARSRRRAVPDAEPASTRNDHFDWRINLLGDQRGDAAALRLSERAAAAPRFERAGARSSPARDSDYVAHRDGADFRPMFTQRRDRASSKMPATGCMRTSRRPCLRSGVARARDGRTRCRCAAELTRHDTTTRRRRHDGQPARSRARLPPLPDARQDLGHADQGDGHAARPGAGLLAGRRRGLHGDRRRPAARPAT